MSSQEVSQHLLRVAEQAKSLAIDAKEIPILEEIITKLKKNSATVLMSHEYELLQKLETKLKNISSNEKKTDEEALTAELLNHGMAIYEQLKNNRLPQISFWLKDKYISVPDPYYILKLPTTSTEKEIKKRFRLLSRIFHPDLSRGNRVLSEEVFKFVNNANELLNVAKTRDLVKNVLRGAPASEKTTQVKAQGFQEVRIPAINDFSDFLQYFDNQIAGRLGLTEDRLIKFRQSLKKDFFGSSSKPEILAKFRKGQMPENWISLMMPLIDAVQWQVNQQPSPRTQYRQDPSRAREQQNPPPNKSKEANISYDGALVVGANTETIVKRNQNNFYVDRSVSLMRLFGDHVYELFKNKQAAGLIHPGNKYGGGAVCEDAAALFKDNSGAVHLTVADTAGGMANKSESTVTNLGSDFAVSVVEAIQHYITNYPTMSLPQILQEVNNSLMNLHDVDNRYLEAKRKGEKIMATAAHVSIYPDGNFRAIAVADARVYRLFNGVLNQVTDDQTPVADMVRNGVVTPQMADNHQRRNEIGEAIGEKLSYNISTREKSGQLRKGEMILVVTDGATQDQFTSSWLNSVINRAPNPTAVISNIYGGINASMQSNHSQDNIAVLCYQFK